MSLLESVAMSEELAGASTDFTEQSRYTVAVHRSEKWNSCIMRLDRPIAFAIDVWEGSKPILLVRLAEGDAKRLGEKLTQLYPLEPVAAGIPPIAKLGMDMNRHLSTGDWEWLDEFINYKR